MIPNKWGVLAAVLAAIMLFLLDRSALNDLSIYHSADWWSPDSPFRILHRMNSVRIPYFVAFIRDSAVIVDLGCGGGFVTEEVARQLPNATVVGFDISAPSIEKARLHGKFDNLNYHVGSIYAVPLGPSSVDAVIVSDVFEHLEDLDSALMEIGRILKPNGLLVFDTIAKTMWSWLSTYFFGQQILGLVVAGAHDWHMFIDPAELEHKLVDHGFATNRETWAGIDPELSLSNALAHKSFLDVIQGFTRSSDMSANYMGVAAKLVNRVS